MNGERELQRELTSTALTILEGRAFALAGSGAIREHGIVDRPTQDIDLFTNNVDPEFFDAAINLLETELRHTGLIVEEVRRNAQFAQLRITTTDDRSVEMDLAVDWRQREPVTLSVGPVLSLEDAVGSKVGALYTRAEARDYLDLDAIRSSGHFTDAQLLTAAAERDAGFELDMFASQLEQVKRIHLDRVTRYGVSADQLEAIKARFIRWANELREPSPEESGSARNLVAESTVIDERNRVERQPDRGRDLQARRRPTPEEMRMQAAPQSTAPGYGLSL